jgi:nucleoid-associated protein YgaU
MAKRFFLMFALWGLVGSCAYPPRQELAEAQAEVARAYAAGAARVAPDDYRIAADALRKGEALVAAGDYQNARQLLPYVVGYARRALLLTREAKIREKREDDLHPPATDQPVRTAAPTPPESRDGIKPARSPNQPAPSPPPPAPLTSYIVRGGETLWTIAADPQVYGDPLLWPLLYQANRDQIKDPRQVFGGQILTIPRAASPAELADAREKAKTYGFFPPQSHPDSQPTPSR